VIYRNAPACCAATSAGVRQQFALVNPAQEEEKPRRLACWLGRDRAAARRISIFSRETAVVAPVVGRVRALWEAARDAGIAAFPKAPGFPKDKSAYLKFVEDIYKSDAYHSLSIEGYSVTPELIEKVKAGNWNPQKNEADRQNRDALAARGYWQAFQKVKQSISQIIAGAKPGPLVRTAHRD
jgi:hypothetical protein